MLHDGSIPWGATTEIRELHLEATMSQSDDLRGLIKQHERSLQSLEEQAGTFGFHTPPHITMEIENIEAKLRALSARLAELDRQKRSEHPQDSMIIPLWSESAAGGEAWPSGEQEAVRPNGRHGVRNVTQPTLTAYLPDPAAATGTAVIVCPGGAWHYLAIHHEGVDVASWLTAHGIAAFILKYRLVHTGDDLNRELEEAMADPARLAAVIAAIGPQVLADGQQAVRLARQRAAEWGVAADRIGMLGFSAGGMVATNVALTHDAASRPDFLAAIYTAPYADVPVPADAPSLFALCAADDPMAAPLSLRLFSRWQAAGHPAELHIYARGGHGFGMLKVGLPSDAWIERFHDWLQAQGLLNPRCFEEE
jgi:acetyl esterase/lipase